LHILNTITHTFACTLENLPASAMPELEPVHDVALHTLPWAVYTQ
jgi:hypothetical protein